MTKWILIGMVIMCAIISPRCNTFHGMGKDIESLGHAMKKSADNE